MARFGKLGIVASGGALPVRIVEGCVARGENYHVIRLAGLTDPSLAFHPGEDCGLAEIGKIIRSLKAAGCDAAVFAGVVARPDFSKLKPDWRGAILLPKVVAAAARGDGALLSVLVDELEAEGIRVIGAEEAAGGLAVGKGVLGRHAPSKDNLADIRKAAQLVHALGPFDVGQGAVVASGFVLAIEAAEGTDAMLERCAAFPASARGGDAANGVLVKRPKPDQEKRIDLPTIGVETVRRAHRAGLAGVAVEAGGALVIDIAEMTAEADRLGLFIYGFSPEEVEAT
ncbi:MAG: UDP-2,3-diacylglucosamine diphosphatase LpxI [Pseudomonadota bacterium]|nr:UDP-2,3-diacylglucosamine diphosphatase LpxI [Pseudomonadota bacterium]